MHDSFYKQEQLLPAPHFVEYTNRRFELPADAVMVFHGGANPDEIARLFRERFNAPIPVKHENASSSEILGVTIAAADDADAGKWTPGKGAGKAEGYSLEIREGSIRMCASSGAGFFYGTRSLDFFLHKENIPTLKIEDFPVLSWRGYGAFFGGHNYKNAPDALECYKKMAVAAAAAKLNVFTFEVDNLPDDNELAEFGKFCRERFIEPVPVNAFLCMGSHDVCRYVEADENEFAALMAPADRAIRILHPAVLCIAGDEIVDGYDVIGRGTIYSDAQRRVRAPHEWLAMALNRMHGHLAKSNVRMAMWADGMLDLEKFWGDGCEMKDYCGGKPDYHALAVEQLPRDIIMWDWQYIPDLANTSLDYLAGCGFEVVGNSFMGKLAERSYAEYGVKRGYEKFAGMMALTWGNQRVDEDFVPEKFLESGEAFWSVGKYTLPMPERYRKFHEIQAKANPLLGLSGEGTLKFSDKYDIAFAAAGRIQGRIMNCQNPGWLETVAPGVDWHSELRYLLTCADGEVFEKIKFTFKSGGGVGFEVYSGPDVKSPSTAFDLVGEVGLRDETSEFEFGDPSVSGNRFCLWLKVLPGNLDRKFLREMSIEYKTVPRTEC